MDIKGQIDQELSKVIVSENLRERILRRSRKRIWKFQPAYIFVCLLLAGGTVSAGLIMYSQIHVNEQTLPQLAPFEKKTVNKSKAMGNEAQIYEDHYSRYEDLCEDLGIALLYSDFAEGNPYMLIERRTDNENWNEIRIKAFIVGDLEEIIKIPEADCYSWKRGLEFSSPIDMDIDIITSNSQLEHGWDRDFLGYYEYTETYTSKQGYVVNISRDYSVQENEEERIKPDYSAVFVADGIRYRLKGQVTLERMKEIIDTLHEVSIPFDLL